MKNLKNAALLLCALSSVSLTGLARPVLAQEADVQMDQLAEQSLTGDAEMDLILASLPSSDEVVAVTLSSAGPNFQSDMIAAGPPPNAPEPPVPHMPPGGAWHHNHGPLSALRGPLALTADQYEKLYNLKNEFIDANAQKFTELAKLHRQLKDSLCASEFSPNKSADIASQIATLKSSVEKSKMDRLIACAQVLTPDQRKAVHDAMIRRAVEGGGKGKMGHFRRG